MEATTWGSACRSIALSWAVGGPLPWRYRTIWLRIESASSSARTCSSPSTVMMNFPAALASAISFASAALSAGVSPCAFGATRLSKIRGELTIAACSGWATGTLMTSMRNQAVLGSCDGIAAVHPASSLGERTADEPEMYT